MPIITVASKQAAMQRKRELPLHNRAATNVAKSPAGSKMRAGKLENALM
jgi:hypothetical protein